MKIINNLNKEFLSESNEAQFRNEIKAAFNVVPTKANIDAMYDSAEFKTPITSAEVRNILNRAK